MRLAPLAFSGACVAVAAISILVAIAARMDHECRAELAISHASALRGERAMTVVHAGRACALAVPFSSPAREACSLLEQLARASQARGDVDGTLGAVRAAGRASRQTRWLLAPRPSVLEDGLVGFSRNVRAPSESRAARDAAAASAVTGVRATFPLGMMTAAALLVSGWGIWVTRLGRRAVAPASSASSLPSVDRLRAMAAFDVRAAAFGAAVLGVILHVLLLRFCL